MSLYINILPHKIIDLHVHCINKLITFTVIIAHYYNTVFDVIKITVVFPGLGVHQFNRPPTSRPPFFNPFY